MISTLLALEFCSTLRLHLRLSMRLTEPKNNELSNFLALKALKFCITIYVAFTNVSLIIVGSVAMERSLFENSFDTSAVMSLIATKNWFNGKRLRSVIFFFIVALWLSCTLLVEGVRIFWKWNEVGITEFCEYCRVLTFFCIWMWMAVCNSTV